MPIQGEEMQNSLLTATERDVDSMAIKNMGRTLSGCLMAFCIILLFSLSISGQPFTPSKKTFTISGSVGLSGVTMGGLPVSVITNENGYYSATVEYGWSGKVKPVLKGYTFTPSEVPYNSVKSNFENQNYTFDIMKFTVSGSVGQPGVVMTGLQGNPVSGADGTYKGLVEYGWNGTVVPELAGYIFTPLSKPYTQVDREYIGENYKAEQITFTISGTVSEPGVQMTGLPTPVVSGANGNYTAVVPYGWMGTVKPEKLGFNFNPSERPYSDIIAAQTYQDYIPEAITFTISGTANTDGVTMKGLPNNPLTNSDGSYIAVVPYNYSGTVTPEKRGYTFKPQSMPYNNVTSDFNNQNYTSEPITYTISGTVGKEGVVMTGLLGSPISSGPNGNYSAVVPFEWGGTVTPEMIGYTFSPPSQTYIRVTANVTQNYSGAPITFTISGSTGVSGVEMKGLPGRVVTDQNGNYNTLVPYGWNGTVTPEKEGYVFNPSEKTYPPLISAEINQDYNWTLQKRTISGRIISAEGAIESVQVSASGGGSAITGANGNYELTVDYGWNGTIMPEKQGLTFKPAIKTYPRVVKDQTGQDYTAETVMLTLSGTLIMGGVPMEGVLMSASEGGISGTTDAQGRYAVKVPYGWNGEISPLKEGYDFNPPSKAYTNVTTDYVDGNPVSRPEPKRSPPPIQQTSPVITPPVSQTPVTGPSPETRASELIRQGAKVEVSSGQNQFEQQKTVIGQQIETLQEQVDKLLKDLSVERPTGPNAPPVIIDTNIPKTPFSTQETEKVLGAPSSVSGKFTKVRGGPLVNYVCIDTDLREVLKNLEAQTGVKIYADSTVKGTVTTRLVNIPLEKALEEVLKDTGLAFKEVPNSYLVYKPISNTFFDSDIRDALQNIATMAGVIIIPDETVGGTVTAVLEGVPLDTALDIVLAGSPYVVKKTPYYYLVASSKVDDPAFATVSETRRVKLNYIASNVAVQLLSTAFRSYIQAEIGTNTVVVTAPARLMDRILSDLKEMDRAPRHVMLDARIVVMEKSNLLNLGIEWGWPKISAGVFGSDFFGGGNTDLQFHGDWPWGVQIGYTTDATFTNSLTMTLNLLNQNGEADIVSSPQVLAQDGRQAQLNVMNEEYYYLSAPERTGGFYTEAELKQIDAGTRLEITPHIGDNNDITLDIVTEVSDVVARGQQTDQALPLVTVSRRRANNTVRIKDGGTVAIAGLTENKTIKTNKRVPGISRVPVIGELFKNNANQQSSKEIAVFITARLVPERQELVEFAESNSEQVLTKPADEETFRMKIRQSLMSTTRK
jgi:type II secretory pathway component GspD/PulD (secretin)